MSDQIAISVKEVSKDFRLPHEKVDSLKDNFVNLFRTSSKEAEMQHALKNISFEVKKGEFFGIVGRNGSGKSTLLKMIASIYRPTKGSIQVNGRLVPFIELGVGFNPDLTGRENVYLNGALMGFSEKEVDSKYDAIVDFAELERFMDQKLKNYSSGMQVRLAFSVATILAESDVLLIDEVLAVGDADFQKKCFQYFQKLKRDKKTVIFVSHDMNAVQQFCDKAVLIEAGRIVHSGSPYDISSKYSKLFLHQSKSVNGENGKRWGDGRIRFTKPEVIFHQDDKEIEIRATASSSAETKRPLFGFSVKDGSGKILTGTNTTIIKADVGSLAKGKPASVSWKFDNIFNSGNYTVDITVSYAGVTSDWWEDAVSFSVSSLTDNPYIVNPKVTFSKE